MARIIAALGFCCLSGLTVAGGSLDEDIALADGSAEVISLATGKRQALRRAPAVATVITAEDIRALGATGLDELLESVPGMHVSTLATTMAANYVMRGQYTPLTNSQLLLMRNGVPMSATYTADKGTLWKNLPLENVARIEVIRGPGSALYGADAFAGVINIVTKGAAELAGAEAGLRLGSFRSGDAWLQQGGQWQGLQWAYYLRHGETQGQQRRVEADAATRLDRLFGTQASRAPGPLAMGYRAWDLGAELSSAHWRLHASTQRREGAHMGPGLNNALDPDSAGRALRHIIDLNWGELELSPSLSVGGTVSVMDYSEQIRQGVMLFPPGTRIGPNVFTQGMIGGPQRWERQWRASSFLNYAGWAGHALRLGLGVEKLHLHTSHTFKNFLLGPTGVPVPTGPVIDYSEIQPHIAPSLRRNHYAYVQDEWQLASDWALTLGLRRDQFSDFGATTNPRLALVWDAAYNLTLKLLSGTAFRAPSFDEQYSINPVSIGNPALRPERIRTHEVALDWQPRVGLSLRASLFRSELTDLIGVVAKLAPAVGASYQNQGRQRAQGAEIELNGDASRELHLGLQLSLQSSRDLASGLPLGNVPRQHLQLRADWRLAPLWQLGAQGHLLRDRPRAPGDTRPALPNTRRVDLNLRRLEAQGLEWTLGLRNLFNADLREPSRPNGNLPEDLPLAGRSAYLEARLHF